MLTRQHQGKKRAKRRRGKGREGHRRRRNVTETQGVYRRTVNQGPQQPKAGDDGATHLTQDRNPGSWTPFGPRQRHDRRGHGRPAMRKGGKGGAKGSLVSQ